MLGYTQGLRALGIAAFVAVSTVVIAAPTVAASTTSATTSTATRVVQIAEQQRGKAYVYGAEGPRAFDCSGLVRYAYLRAGANSRLGGGHSGTAMLAWARAHHRFSTSNPQIGDVVVYGGGAHVAIYIGRGRVISALNPRQGIRITGLHALSSRVTGYIHTHLSQASTKSLAVTTTASAARFATTTSSAVHTVLTNGYTNLRAGASTASHKVAVLAPDVALRLIGSVVAHGHRWDHVLYHGRSSWVRADLVHAA